MRELSKILAVQANIDHIEWILVIKMWDIRNFTTNRLILIYTLCTNPILIAL
jgi:hypothetical protein